jgi:hypothetical protein
VYATVVRHGKGFFLSRSLSNASPPVPRVSAAVPHSAAVPLLPTTQRTRKLVLPPTAAEADATSTSWRPARAGGNTLIATARSEESTYTRSRWSVRGRQACLVLALAEGTPPTECPPGNWDSQPGDAPGALLLGSFRSCYCRSPLHYPLRCQ